MFAFMLPMRPGKLRLVVETTTSRFAGQASWAPKTGPQPGLRTVAPASRMILHQPPGLHLVQHVLGRGDDEALTSGWTFLPFESLGDLLHIVDTAVGTGAHHHLGEGVPATSFTGTTLAGQKGFAIWGSSLERSTSRTSAVSLPLGGAEER